MKKEFIGIDVSKRTLDAWAYHAGYHGKFSNDEKGFDQLLQWIEKQVGLAVAETTFCFEHTGLYSLELGLYLQSRKLPYYLVSGLAVKYSSGLKRGKTDKNDARMLALYAYQKREELQPYQMPCKTIIKLRRMLSFRTQLVKQASSYKALLTEAEDVSELTTEGYINETSVEILDLLKRKIKGLEMQMMQLIEADEQIAETFHNIRSIKGVGMVLAITMIASTNNFQWFSCWRKFACYAGIAPFEHTSGTSYKGKTRVSKLGNRVIKLALSRAAASAIQYNPEMKIYYQKRIEQGKNKMATLNIIRNKLVSRMFAVANRKSPYIEIHKFAA